jgi:hypothetical protein
MAFSESQIPERLMLDNNWVTVDDIKIYGSGMNCTFRQELQTAIKKTRPRKPVPRPICEFGVSRTNKKYYPFSYGARCKRIVLIQLGDLISTKNYHFNTFSIFRPLSAHVSEKLVYPALRIA